MIKRKKALVPQIRDILTTVLLNQIVRSILYSSLFARQIISRIGDDVKNVQTF